MNLSSLITGLTMLRAYNCVRSIGAMGDDPEAGGVLCAYVDREVQMHPDDLRRLDDDGWIWDETNGRWELECS